MAVNLPYLARNFMGFAKGFVVLTLFPKGEKDMARDVKTPREAYY